MEPPFRNRTKEKGLIDLLRSREVHETTARILPRKLHVTDNFIARLGLERELEGHKGCVNCLEWNESGGILASASDDMHLILWDPFRYQKKLVRATGHNGNIFSVKFLPKSNDSILVTGAADNGVRVHDVSATETILACNCHAGRVKRLATVENVPFLFWSAGEDGLILQYDMRMRHNCRSQDRTCVLINLVNHIGRQAEAKCVAVNARRPELIAVGANDAYVRIYDRRMIKLSQVPVGPEPQNDLSRANQPGASKGDVDDNIPIGCAQYFIAGHLKPTKNRQTERNFASTYLTFSADGNELLVNMGGEQIYLFDIDRHKNSRNFDFPELAGDSDCSENDEILRKCAYGFDSNEESNLKDLNTSELPEDVEKLKVEANNAFQNAQYTFAVNLYNKAIEMCPTASVLYANRAATYMKRKWDSDIYVALRDCQTTLLLDPDHIKAHFRLARCLHDLNRAAEAYKVLEDFQEKFPEYETNYSFRGLRRDIKKALNLETEEVPANNSYLRRLSAHEVTWRRSTIDFKQRFCGHCNTTTDIKETNFFGNNGQYIIAGSDDGSFFVWDRYTTNIVRILRGDERIVNCLQPHPSICLLATSGIDPVIRLWSPLPEDGSVNEREIQNLYEAASANQIRMNSDPFELMIRSMGYRFPSQSTSEEVNEETESVIPSVGCRTS